YLVLTFFLNHLNLVLKPRTEPCTAATVPTMTCHPPIRPAATCTVPRIQLLAATWQHPIGQPSGKWHLRQHRWRTTVDCRWTTVDHHQTTGQRWLVNSQRWTWAGSGSGLGRVSIGSGYATWHATCQPRVSHVCTRGIHVDADVDNMQRVGVEPGALWLKT
nr:hypothetical protein [Tanacetum cinerariifolium]